MTDTLTLSKTQLLAAVENGLICEHYGPVTGTQDIYQVAPISLHNLVMAFIGVGKQLAEKTQGAKVIPMYTSKSRSAIS